jgi:hypothetical protein
MSRFCSVSHPKQSRWVGVGRRPWAPYQFAQIENRTERVAIAFFGKRAADPLYQAIQSSPTIGEGLCRFALAWRRKETRERSQIERANNSGHPPADFRRVYLHLTTREHRFRFLSISIGTLFLGERQAYYRTPAVRACRLPTQYRHRRVKRNARFPSIPLPSIKFNHAACISRVHAIRVDACPNQVVSKILEYGTSEILRLVTSFGDATRAREPYCSARVASADSMPAELGSRLILSSFPIRNTLPSRSMGEAPVGCLSLPFVATSRDSRRSACRVENRPPRRIAITTRRGAVHPQFVSG